VRGEKLSVRPRHRRHGHDSARLFPYGIQKFSVFGEEIAGILFFGGTLLAGILKSETLVTVFTVLENAVMLLLIFRMLSKNLQKRREENQKWVSWWWRIKNKNSGARARHADKEHKYFTCKQCKTICRVPVGKGKIVITCPKCAGQIQAKS
jgi:hypothetical protein